MKTIPLAALLLFLTPGLWASSSSPQPAAPLDPAVQQIGFVRFYDCYEGAWPTGNDPPPHCIESVLMDPDGSHEIPNPPFGAWSPDGTRLLVERWEAPNGVDIFVTSATGAVIANLTNHPGNDYSAAWSHDGARIAFTSDRDGPRDLYVMNADGSGVVRIAVGVAIASPPTWSPDGVRLAFACFVDPVSSSTTNNLDICAIHADGSGFVRLTDAPGRDDYPAWSPDSLRLIFTCIVDPAGTSDICAVDADGSGFARLTSGPGNANDPSWSPDGARILFVSDSYYATEIVVMNPDGTGVTRLASGIYADTPRWSSDGTRIAFVYRIPWDPDWGWTRRDFVYVMNADGTGATELGWGESPFWRPWAGGVNDRPVAAFTVECVGLTCTLDGLRSSDTDGNVESYRWHFGDGTMGSGATVSHTFADGRPRVFSLIVSDDRGALGTAEQAVDINQAPVVSYSKTCIGLTCTFDASATFDPDGTIAFLSWNFGDSSTPSGPVTVTHTYAAAGTYVVTLIAGDRFDRRSSHSQSVTVVSLNVPPVASSTSACIGLTCSFNASGSSDPDGTIASHAWTFGDATSGSGVTATHTYTTAGIYTVLLTITDNAGATRTYTRSVTVVVPPSVHVGDLDRASTSQGTKWTATVTITVHDSNHGLVANASVTGCWNSGAYASCTTNASGRCAISRSGILKTKASVSFTVTNVVRATTEYNPANNHDPDGDSNGISITVSKP